MNGVNKIPATAGVPTIKPRNPTMFTGAVITAWPRLKHCLKYQSHSHHLILSRFFTSSRPFRVLGIQQVAIGSEDRSALSRLWHDIFGLSPTSTHRLDNENVEEEILQLGPSPYAVEVDLMTPIDQEKSPQVPSIGSATWRTTTLQQTSV